MLSVAQKADGKFQMMSLKDQLGLTQAQKDRVKDTNAAKSLDDEPHFWVHYDKEMEEISITQSRAEDDGDDESEDESEDDMERGAGRDAEHSIDSTTAAATATASAAAAALVTKGCGAADDAF